VKPAPVVVPVDGPAGGDPPAPSSAETLSEGVAEVATQALEDVARMPWNVWVGTSTSYQTLFNADAVSNDSLVSYLDIVLTAELWEGATMELEFEGAGGNGPDGQIPGYANVWSAWNANSGTYQIQDGFDRLLVAEGSSRWATSHLTGCSTRARSRRRTTSTWLAWRTTRSTTSSRPRSPTR